MAVARGWLAWSQVELGERLAKETGQPWSTQLVSAAEKGNRAFNATEVVAICNVMGMTLADLFVDVDVIAGPEERSPKFDRLKQDLSSIKSELGHISQRLATLAG